jgi:wyosine [tRNA(Phe)-imidazoG37] synthetase (radical SAM superfamily)
MPRSDMPVVYGPIVSRRFGSSLGINVLGDEKVCSFDCVYCHLGPTEVRLNKIKSGILPSLELLKSAITEGFRKIHAGGPHVDTICISGNGEPTVHPDLAEVIDHLLIERSLWLPQKPLVILSDGAHLDQRKLIAALNKIDERIIKIDVGNERAFKAFNRPISRANLARVTTGVRELKDFTAQSLFVGGEHGNTKSADIDDWLEVIAILKPKSVQIHGLSRPGPVADLVPCDEDTLYTIASKLERRTGIKARITL